MAGQKSAFEKYGWTIVDIVLLGILSTAIAYLCLPWLAKAGKAIGDAAQPGEDISAGAQNQSERPSHLPDEFEFGEGHAYMGNDWVKWKGDKLEVGKRVADMKGKGGFDEKVEQLKPSPEAWERFWARVDSLGIWEWKPDYSSSRSSMPDGDSWNLNLKHGKKQVKSKGYNAVPERYSDFRAAAYNLIEDARRASAAKQ